MVSSSLISISLQIFVSSSEMLSILGFGLTSGMIEHFNKKIRINKILK